MRRSAWSTVRAARASAVGIGRYGRSDDSRPVRFLAFATQSGAGRRRASVALRVELGRWPALLVGVEAVRRRPCGARPARRGRGGGAFAGRREHSQSSARIRRWCVMPRPGARPRGVRFRAAGRPTGLVDGRGIGCTEGPHERAPTRRDLGPRWTLRHTRWGLDRCRARIPHARGARVPGTAWWPSGPESTTWANRSWPRAMGSMVPRG